MTEPTLISFSVCWRPWRVLLERGLRVACWQSARWSRKVSPIPSYKLPFYCHHCIPSPSIILISNVVLCIWEKIETLSGDFHFYFQNTSFYYTLRILFEIWACCRYLPWYCDQLNFAVFFDNLGSRCIIIFTINGVPWHMPRYRKFADLALLFYIWDYSYWYTL